MNFVQIRKNCLEKPSLEITIDDVNAMQAKGAMRAENKGYARNFDRPELHEGRIERQPMAGLNRSRMDKPWLDGFKGHFYKRHGRCIG